MNELIKKPGWLFIWGMVLGGAGAATLGYLLNIAGLVTVTGSPGSAVTGSLEWLYANLGLSVIPFVLILIGFSAQLRRLRRLLNADNPSPEDVQDAESKVDLLTSVFFGVGVIWTAIGMRNALLAGLGDLNAETAANKGAWYVLNQLIDGGILLALSTTIAGGIGGYILRCIKTWLVGPQLHAFYEVLVGKPHGEVISKLKRIIELLNSDSAANLRG